MTRPTWDQLREWRPHRGTAFVPLTPPEPNRRLIGDIQRGAPPERLLTGSGLARASDPPTSHAAAAHDVGGHRARVLRAVASFTTPANRDMIAAKSGLSAYEASMRIPELAQAGLIEAVGTLVGYSGREQTAYRVTTAGLRVLRNG